MKLISSIDEGLYYALWFDTPQENHHITPRVVPTSDRNISRPSDIPFTSVLHATPLYIQRIIEEPIWRSGPSMVDSEQKLLRSINSTLLGPNCYAFSGMVTACDRYQLFYRSNDGKLIPKDRWTIKYIVDCGVPLHFRDEFDLNLNCWQDRVQDGVFLEGLIRLSFSAFSTKMGLHQAISTKVNSVEILDLRPKSDTYGQLYPVDFGTHLHYDAEQMLPQETLFMSFDTGNIGPLSYGTIPARSPECPEPDYPGLVHLGEDNSIRIVELG